MALLDGATQQVVPTDLRGIARLHGCDAVRCSRFKSGIRRYNLLSDVRIQAVTRISRRIQTRDVGHVCGRFDGIRQLVLMIDLHGATEHVVRGDDLGTVRIGRGQHLAVIGFVRGRCRLAFRVRRGQNEVTVCDAAAAVLRVGELRRAALADQIAMTTPAGTPCRAMRRGAALKVWIMGFVRIVENVL